MSLEIPAAAEVVAIARRAGDAILEIYGTEFDVSEKDDKSPLTAADMAAHQVIVDGLFELTPDIPVLSEESAKLPFDVRRNWTRYWLVDPLDGTKEFIRRNGEFTVNIAFVKDGVPVLGVVHVPVQARTYWGRAGDGAWVQDAEAAPVEIHARTRRAETLQVVGSRSHAGDSLQQFLSSVGAHEMVSMGSSLKLCLVAEGKADIYPRLGPTSEWDTAAAQGVVEASGGKVTDLELKPLRYNTKDSLLNPYFLVFGDQSADWRAHLNQSEAPQGAPA